MSRQTVQIWQGTVELPGQAQSGEVSTLPARLTFTQVVDALAAADCQWERLKPIEECALRTLSQRVDLTFATDDGPEPVLHVAGTWSHEHDCIPEAIVAAAFADDFPPEQADD